MFNITLSVNYGAHTVCAVFLKRRIWRRGEPKANIDRYSEEVLIDNDANLSVEGSNREDESRGRENDLRMCALLNM